MKLYHLADLHFGKTVYGISMLEDQRYWAERFLEYCLREKPDAILIAGDVYDRAAPGAEAVELLDSFLTSLSENGFSLFIIAGNHDSPQRLSFARNMLAKQKVHISGLPGRILDHFTLQDEYGPVTVWMLPYTYPEQVSEVLDEELNTYETAVRRLLSLQDIDLTQRNVILSHQNVTAFGKEAERTGSESMVGGVGQIDYSVYEDFDYAALGHIHSSYSVGRDTVRYAGTPLCYHFSETRQKDKGFLEIILSGKSEEILIRSIALEPLHRMRYYKGTKDEIYSLVMADKNREEYVGITLTDQRVTPEISSFLRNLYTSRGSVLAELLSDYTSSPDHISSAEAAESKSLEDLFSELYSEQYGGVPPRDEEYELMQAAGELVRRGDPHLPLDQKDVESLLTMAKQIGGKQ